MPLQEEQKSSTPLKRADIKTLLLAASTRKRKASSPIPPPTEAKNVKVCDKESDDDIQVLDVSVNSDVCASDSKENQDVNTLKSEQVVPRISTVISDNDLKSVESDEHMSSEDASSDGLNSSLLNSSVNALNTSLSEANQGTGEKSVSENTNKVASNPKSGENNEQEKKTNVKKRKKMTPEEAKKRAEEREKKQQERLLKKQELEARKLERERELQQRKLQKEMEKKAKEEERKEKERLRLEKKEQEEKEKQMKQEEREEQKRMRQAMLEAKLEKKKQMEEMKLKQAEERKKAEEEKKKAELEKEQREREKKEKAKAAFVKFFVKENTSPPPSTQKCVEQDSIFKPFQISEDMTLAPVIPEVSKKRFNREIFDAAVTPQNDTHLYLQVLKSGSYKDVRHRKKERKPKLCETDVIIVETDQIGLNLRAKLIQFSENVRPPYWGTWRKKSKAVRPRNPFGQDDIFDYDVDSDDEWDEGGPGESLSGTEQEDESGDDDNYEENEFFVPHGYLSAEEEKDDDETEVDDDPENRKKLLKKKLQEFEMERKKKTTELKPIILGCYIENDLTKPKDSQLLAALEPFSAVFLIDTPIPTSFTVKIQKESKSNSNASSPTSANSTAKSKKASVPDEAMPHLIRLVHGNHHSLAFLITEFNKFWQQHCQSQEPTEKLVSEKPEAKAEGSNYTTVLDSPSTDFLISKRQLNLTLKQIATKRSVDTIKKMVWYVNEEVREKHGLLDLPITNTWTYLTTDMKDDADASPVIKPANSKFSIKEFLA